jgi:cell pole-organizing protein PopZ
MSVNEGNKIEPTLAEVLASIRRIAQFEPDAPSLRAAPEFSHEEFSHEDDPDFVVPAFLRPNSHRAPVARPLATVQFPSSLAERQTPVLPMPPVPRAQPASQFSAQPSARDSVWSNSTAHAPAPHSSASIQWGLPPAVETPRRTLDSAAALFAHTPAPSTPSQTSASPWLSFAHDATAPAPVPNYDEMDAAADLSADLLRPLLRQWLDENMNCMVAKALQSESLSFGTAGKKTN